MTKQEQDNYRMDIIQKFINKDTEGHMTALSVYIEALEQAVIIED